MSNCSSPLSNLENASYETAVEKYNREMKEWIKWKDAEKVEHKRDLWKAASARYYERHPEVKEKKRLKMAEARAAKKLAKRRWDPPKKLDRTFSRTNGAGNTSTANLPTSGRKDTRAQDQLEDIPDVNLELDLSPDVPGQSRPTDRTHDEILQLFLQEQAEATDFSLTAKTPVICAPLMHTSHV
ncbi:hypothetical protein K438DRAFT_1927323 [Mycena galopus ATCC 62051]|nr:hypothetical protein K438DRAFT_1927323 [Mycena galopus ATCC 62051]